MWWEEGQQQWRAFETFVREPVKAEIMDRALDELIGAAAGNEAREEGWAAMMRILQHYYPFKQSGRPGTRRVHIIAAAREGRRSAQAAISALEQLEKEMVAVYAAFEEFPQQLLPDRDTGAAAEKVRVALEEQKHVGLRHEIGTIVQWLRVETERFGNIADYIDGQRPYADRGGPGKTLEYEARGSAKGRLIFAAATIFNQFRPDDLHAGAEGPFYQFASVVLELMTGVPGEEPGQGLRRYVQEAVTTLRAIHQCGDESQ